MFESQLYYSMLRQDPNVSSTHNAIEKDVHARSRGVLSHASSDAALKNVESRILRLICVCRAKIDGVVPSALHISASI